jgi:drug/metabolite transporter (DMT)-like permease
MKPVQKGYLQLILYSLISGLVGVLVKLMKNLDAYSIVFLRAFVAAIFIFAIMIIRKKTKELTLIDPLKTLFVGVFEGLSIVLYFLAVLYTNVSNALFLVYTAPIFSVIFAKIFLREKIEKKTIIGIFVAFLGVVILLDPRTFSFSSKETLGMIMALFSGIFYAAQATVAKPLQEKVNGYYTTFWQYVVIGLMFVLFFRPASASAVAQNWLQLLILGILCSGISTVIFMEGIKKVQAQKIFIITSLEPVAGTIFAAIFLKEIPSIFTLIGAALILYGIYTVTTVTYIAVRKSTRSI